MKLGRAIGAVLLICGSGACAGKEKAGDGPVAVKEPCPACPAPRPDAPEPDRMPAEQLHLGDGTTDYNYYAIIDYLKANPGSAARTAEVAKLQREADAAPPGQLKPPSAGVVETELSHLLGAIMVANGGVGAAVFDNHGLKVAAAGEQIDPIVLDPARRASALATAADAAGAAEPPPFIHRQGNLTAHYRPVIERYADGHILGISVLITRSQP